MARLDDEDRDFLERAVLSMKDGELPDEARMRRIEERLGPVLGAEVSSSGGLRRLAWVAAAALVVVAGGVAMGTRLEAPAPNEPSRVAIPAVAPSRVEERAVPTVSVDALPTTVAEPVAEPPPKSRGAGVNAAPSSASPRAAAEPGDELALLEAARTALADDPARVLDLAAEHVRRFSKPSFAQERERLAIDALVRLGRGREAEARARAFEATWPDSAHLARVRALVAPRAAEETAK